MNEHILIVGGGGYIGSHFVQYVKEQGLKGLVLDDLSTGYQHAVGDTELIIGNCGDTNLLDKIFSEYNIKSVVHFASFIQVGESVTKPDKYYNNNVTNTIKLLNSMIRNGVKNFVFSSTAAIFGHPIAPTIKEDHPQLPINPYGRSKLIIENILADYASAYNLNYGCLRYFNAAGAHPTVNIGERHDPETHLIPLIMQTASNRYDKLRLFGDDYNTPDGTCIRDYVHVCDLASAHLLMLNHLQNTNKSYCFNLGTGKGYSILEVIKAARSVTNTSIDYTIEPRRPGDPNILVANGDAAKNELGWVPQMSDINNILSDAWRWEQFLKAELEG